MAPSWRLLGRWLVALWCVPVVHAHDSWLRPSPAAPARVLEFSTGNRYPVQEIAVGEANLVQQGCTDGEAAVALRSGRSLPLALELHASGERPLACWAELGALDIAIEPPLVDVYLDEIRAGDAVRARWAQQRANGVPWQESYRKFARIELAAAAGATPAQRLAARRPLGWGLEIVVSGDAPVNTSTETRFRVLRDGRPLAGQPVEFISARSALGIWRVSDDQGWVSLRLPLPGAWLLRATQLEPQEGGGPGWRSRFTTLALEAR